MLLSSPKELQKAADYLAKADAVLRPVIAGAGLPTFVPHADYYGALVHSIVGQQLSVKAAAAITKRFEALFDDQLPTPEQILTKSEDELRAIGFSYAKARYVRDLAEHVIDGRVTFDRIPSQSNEEITKELIDVKGVGEWTTHMFLMFCVGRLDVLPVGDLGIRNGIKALYGFTDPPTPEQIRDVAKQNHWHPYESVASWYVWRSLNNAPA